MSKKMMNDENIEPRIIFFVFAPKTDNTLLDYINHTVTHRIDTSFCYPF
jgi:hypothetical protein